MKTPQLLVLLLTIMAHASNSFPSDRKPAQGREKHASWDDVNVVAHGLLQLGQGLKEHVDKSKAQMRDVSTKLTAFNSTVAELQRRQREQGRALAARGDEMEQRAKVAAQLAEEVRARVEEVEKENDDIHSRMGKLEEKVEEVLAEPDTNDSDHSGVLSIQRLVAAQSRRIDHLVEKIQQQQDKLEKQNLHLQALQSKVAQRRVKSHRRRDDGAAPEGEPGPGAATAGLARDCHDLFVQGQRASGVYTVRPDGSQPFNVLCEMTPEGGWTVVQKRQDGSQDFNQLWESYKKGFGSLNGEFWLGLENIHSVTKQGRYILQVELSDQAGEELAARYRFRLDGEEKKFALHLQPESTSGPQDVASASMRASGLPFSTADSDNDLAADVNCARLHSGGWWFSGCGGSNLNGRYARRPGLHRRRQPRARAMFWTSARGQNHALKRSVLKVAPAAVGQ